MNLKQVCYISVGIATCMHIYWQQYVFIFYTALEIRKPRTKPKGTQLGTKMDT